MGRDEDSPASSSGHSLEARYTQLVEMMDDLRNREGAMRGAYYRAPIRQRWPVRWRAIRPGYRRQSALLYRYPEGYIPLLEQSATEAEKEKPEYEMVTQPYELEALALHIRDKADVRESELRPLKTLHDAKVPTFSGFGPFQTLGVFLAVLTFFLATVPAQVIDDFGFNYDHYVVWVFILSILMATYLYFVFGFIWRVRARDRKMHTQFGTVLGYLLARTEFERTLTD